MILSEQQVRRIIRTNPNGAAIKAKQARYEVLRAHVVGGKDAEKLITVVDGIERPNVVATRKKLMLSNRDTITRLLQPRDNIYTAKGGVEEYVMSNEDLVHEFKEYLAACVYNNSLKNYIRDVVQRKYDYDPEGLKWVDLNDYGNPVPCFKSIMQIYDYVLNGRKPEYVVFTCGAAEKEHYKAMGILPENMRASVQVYRVVCDGFDRIVTWEGAAAGDEGLVIVSELENYFGYVPGEIVSDIMGDATDTEPIVYYSPLEPVVELLDHYVFGRSSFNVVMAKSAYPKEWMQIMDCPTCKGIGTIDAATCPECSGSGVLPWQQNSDVLQVDYSTAKGIPNPPMGVIAPAVAGMQFMKENNMSIEDMIDYTIWGVVKSASKTTTTKVPGKGGNESGTAHEADMNMQPKYNRLRRFSRWYAGTMKWWADVCGKYMYESNYNDSAILGGDRYGIESPTSILDRVEKARMANAPRAVLDSLINDYMNSEYANNPLAYRRFRLLYLAEPFYFNTIEQVLGFNVPEIQKLEKIYFDDFVATLAPIDFAMLPDTGGAEILKQRLRAYVEGRYKADIKSDYQLFTDGGQLLEIGDEVEIKEEDADEPEHLGKTYKITEIQNKNVTLSDGVATVNGYNMSNLIKTNSI